MADVAARIGAWADEIGFWALFQVMTMIAQVMELAARAEEADGVA